MHAAELDVMIREFVPGDEGAFRRLNEEWISDYFSMEGKDAEALANPGKTILEPGGRIFFAIRGGEFVGCCALLAMAPGEFEVAKMAVTKSARGAGIGRALLARIIAEARASGISRLYLETNRQLATAIRLYESAGFRHLTRPRVFPSPYERANVFMELRFDESI